MFTREKDPAPRGNGGGSQVHKPSAVEGALVEGLPAVRPFPCLGLLPEEAGGSGLYFTSDSSLGDTVDVQIEGDEDGKIWGNSTIPSLHDGTGAAISLSPSEQPIWCPEVTE